MLDRTMSAPIQPPILLDIPAEIATERLLLRQPRAGDGLRVHEAVVESLPELRRFIASLPWVAGEQSVENSEVWCRASASDFLARKNLPYLLWDKRTLEVVGGSGLHRTDWRTPKTEVGYWCRTSRVGEGLITEAVQALVALAFTTLAAQRIELLADEENHASRRVAERCGFVLEAVLRNERRAPDGALRNTCLYARFPEP
jgi:RimJ/RimL family protein N-acetyltransferase